MSFIKRVTARKCPIHQAIYEQAAEDLANTSNFRKQRVLTRCGYPEDLGDKYVRWDYIREFLEQDFGVELIPVAERFYKQHDAEELERYPRRFIASGHGKRTMGYVLGDIHNGTFALARLQDSKARMEGIAERMQQMRERVQEKLPGSQQKQITQLFDGDAAA